MSEAKAKKLEKLLEDERDMILAGQFDALGPMTERKTEALEALPDWELPREHLARIASSVTRNQTLLDAAIRGMKAARTRIETVIGAAGTLSTYDSNGQITDLGRHRSGLEKKA